MVDEGRPLALLLDEFDACCDDVELLVLPLLRSEDLLCRLISVLRVSMEVLNEIGDCD